ncbi:MAG: asparagine--tRNA ligase [Candidatus Bostrichicola ureolyticus]|nr:MAG: asparagine--tRNA ligase [Candidatus Bostrichicola ureolyticus]
MNIKNILSNKDKMISKDIVIKGWVRAFRSFRFIEVNDGSTWKNIQIFIDNNFDKSFLKKININASIEVNGIIVNSKGKKQDIEIYAKSIHIFCSSDIKELQKTILQPKNHSLKKLREQAHLRFRTNIFSAIMRIRHNLAFAIHKFFNDKGFYYIHTPIITSIDAEGAGKMFRVTTLDNFDKKIDFFGKTTYLTVSGQLEAEAAALALGKVYTFGPTFRAENSNTYRHLSEFWMIEPEIAFYELNETIQLAIKFLKFIILFVTKYCSEDLIFLNDFNQKIKKQNTINYLESILNKPFEIISYTKAINILQKKYSNIVWGIDLQSEHEKYLVEKYFKSPVIIFDYPEKIKAFYMRINKDEKTVSAMDILLPNVGEIIGGSQREERYDILYKRIHKMNIDINNIKWYLDTRRFGSVPHSGFGLGFDRLVQFVTCMSNIRDVIPFPRIPGNAEF